MQRRLPGSRRWAGLLSNSDQSASESGNLSLCYCIIHVQVKQLNEKELSLLEQQLQQTTCTIAASLHSGAACLQSAFSVPLDVEPARSTLRAEVCTCSLHHCHDDHMAAGCKWDDHDAASGPCDGQLVLASCTESPAGSKRSWVLLEKVLARTCTVWQEVDADQQHLMNLQQDHLALVT